MDAVYEADVLSAECRVIGLNPYGCVSAGSLTLSAVVFNARLQPRTEPHSKLHGESPPIASPAGTFSSTAAALVVDAAESWKRIQCVLSRLSLDHNRWPPRSPVCHSDYSPRLRSPRLRQLRKHHTCPMPHSTGHVPADWNGYVRAAPYTYGQYPT